MRIVIGSGSIHKSGPLKAYCKERGWDPNDVVACKASSGGPEQPVGLEQAVECGLNRLTDTQRLEPNAEIFVAIESYIEWKTVMGLEFCFDHAVVLVRTRWGKVFIAPSQGIEFPIEAVRKANELGFATTTVGSIIAKMYGKEGEDGTDPHAILTRRFGRTSPDLNRAATLLVALRWAFAGMSTQQ